MRYGTLREARLHPCVARQGQALWDNGTRVEPELFNEKAHRDTADEA